MTMDNFTVGILWNRIPPKRQAEFVGLGDGFRGDQKGEGHRYEESAKERTTREFLEEAMSFENSLPTLVACYPLRRNEDSRCRVEARYQRELGVQTTGTAWGCRV